jgi:hypothetical protein
MPFGLKNALSEFQNIMNDIFNPFSHFTIVYIDDVLIFSKSIEEHWKHLNAFLETIKHNGLVVSASNIKLFQTKIRFLGFDISEGKIRPIDKFSDVITEKLSFKDSLVLSIILLISTKICESIANLCLTDCGAIRLLGLMNILLLLNKSKSMSRLFLVLVFLLIMLSKLLKLMLLKLDSEVF